MPGVTIHDILAQFRDEELHNRHLGDRFERPSLGSIGLGLDSWQPFHVTKMTFAKPTAEQKAAGLKADKPPIHSLAVCSNLNIGKRSSRDAPGDDDTAAFRVRSGPSIFSSQFYHKQFHH